jgi:hypothetical protein
MLERFKNIFKGVFRKRSFVTIKEDGSTERNNPNECFYCNKPILKERFCYRYGKHFHKRCIKLYSKEKGL